MESVTASFFKNTFLSGIKEVTRRLNAIHFFNLQHFFRTILLLLCFNHTQDVTSQVLKSIVYDFDGFDLNQTSLPEGDYSFGDLTYKTTSNPLTSSHMLGDRVLQMNVNWLNNYGAFGRGISRYIEFDADKDRLNFFFYNPISNNQSATLEVKIGDDDNQNNTYETASDDTWKKEISIPGSSTWQLISIPLKDFTDSNTGGNGIFDIAFTQNKGMLLIVEFRFNKKVTGLSNAVFYMDMICFTEGILPHGTTELDLPYKSPSDYCLLGAYQLESVGNNHLIPQHFESLFPQVSGKRIEYVNTFLQWGSDGTAIAKTLPGNSIQLIINNGYKPIITWEPMFKGFAPLDPVQPRLDNINSGQFDAYIDTFAAKIKTYSDTVIIRFMHEFEGNWYPWSISQNNGDPTKFVNAYRRVVQKFRDKGVTNVQWMWCGNSDYAPYSSYNWLVDAYPGDAYVDIVATDIYNSHYPTSLPWWRSFRWQTTESYYYLSKYFPQKPVFICEVGVRERTNTEPISSQSKAAWFAAMDKELQSNFKKARALIFFNALSQQNWLVNTSATSLQSLIDNIWYDSYYFKPQNIFTDVKENEYGSGLYVYPNPSTGVVTLSYTSAEAKETYKITIYNSNGDIIYSEIIKENTNSFTKNIDMSFLAKGIYLVELKGEISNITKVKELRKLVFL